MNGAASSTAEYALETAAQEALGQIHEAAAALGQKAEAEPFLRLRLDTMTAETGTFYVRFSQAGPAPNACYCRTLDQVRTIRDEYLEQIRASDHERTSLESRLAALSGSLATVAETLDSASALLNATVLPRDVRFRTARLCLESARTQLVAMEASIG